MSERPSQSSAGLTLCSQCGERPAAMLKLGTIELWCPTCLDEAADTALRERVEALADEWDALDMGMGLYPEDSAHRQAHGARAQQCADDLRAALNAPPDHES